MGIWGTNHQNIIGLATVKTIVEVCVDWAVTFLRYMDRATTNEVDSIVLCAHRLTLSLIHI